MSIIAQLQEQFSPNALNRYRDQGAKGAEIFITKDFGPSFAKLLEHLAHMEQMQQYIYGSLPSQGDIVQGLQGGAALLTECSTVLEMFAASPFLPPEYTIGPRSLLLKIKRFFGQIDDDTFREAFASIKEESAALAAAAEEDETPGDPPPPKKSGRSPRGGPKAKKPKKPKATGNQPPEPAEA